MHFKKFAIATPLLGISGIFLMPRRQFFEPMSRRTTVLTALFGIAILVGIGVLASCLSAATAAPTRGILRRTLEPLFTNPLGLAVVWTWLMYVGLRRWRKQLVSK